MRYERGMMHLGTVAAVTVGFILLAGTGAVAQEAQPCKADVEKFCQGVQPGGGRIAACLKQHKDEVSPACKSRIAQAEKRLKEVHQACEDDIMSFCAGVEPGDGRVAKCLKAHQDQLSAECKGAIGKAKKGT